MAIIIKSCNTKKYVVSRKEQPKQDKNERVQHALPTPRDRTVRLERQTVPRRVQESRRQADRSVLGLEMDALL